MISTELVFLQRINGQPIVSVLYLFLYWNQPKYMY